MYSSQDNRCSHRLGSPIRKSPDHRLLASPRGLSQLATSFIAYLRQGIHTHALSSLTIKLTLRSRVSLLCPCFQSNTPRFTKRTQPASRWSAVLLSRLFCETNPISSRAALLPHSWVAWARLLKKRTQTMS